MAILLSAGIILSGLVFRNLFPHFKFSLWQHKHRHYLVLCKT